MLIVRTKRDARRPVPRHPAAVRGRPRRFQAARRGGDEEDAFARSLHRGDGVFRGPEDAFHVHVHDLQATILHLLGIDHEQLTFKFQGRRYRLTDVAGKVVHPILT